MKQTDAYIPWLDDPAQGAQLIAGARARLVLAALGESTRYELVEYLLALGAATETVGAATGAARMTGATGGATASDLAYVAGAKLPAVMHHLAILKQAGLIRSGERRRQGRRLYTATPAARELMTVADRIAR